MPDSASSSGEKTEIDSTPFRRFSQNSSTLRAPGNRQFIAMTAIGSSPPGSLGLSVARHLRSRARHRPRVWFPVDLGEVGGEGVDGGVLEEFDAGDGVVELVLEVALDFDHEE